MYSFQECSSEDVIPYKWVAPEGIVDHIFGFKTDVW